MDYYNENMESIKINKNYLYNDILSFQDNKDNYNDIEVVESILGRDGNLVLTIRRKGKQYRMNSLYRPIDEAKKWSEQFDLNKLMITLVMYGFGNGYFTREILKKLKKNDLMIIFEPSEEVFIHVISNYAIKDILEDRRIIIFIGEKGKKQFYDTFGSRIHWSNFNSGINCKHPSYEEVYPEPLKYFEQAIVENIERILANRSFENNFSRETVENLLNSIKHMVNSNYLDDLKGLWDSDIPVVIVAAGPSLDLNIDELKNAKGKAVIIATDTALRTLHAHYIQPDIVITIDPKKELELFYDVGFEEIPLICTTYSTSHILNKHIGKKIWFAIHPYMIRMYNSIGIKKRVHNTGASVATAAFAACRALGFKKIILIGQDLAYKGEFTHAGDKISSNDQKMGSCYVEGINGKPIKSRSDWRYFLHWFERMITEDTDDNNIVIDATEGGAKIKGTVLMTLKEAIAAYCIKSVNIRELIDDLEPTLDKEALLQIILCIEKDLLDLEEIIKMSQESSALCSGVIKEYKSIKTITPSISKKYKKISKMNDKIIGKNIYTLAEELVKGNNDSKLQEINELTENEFDNLINTYNIQKKMMNDLNKSSRELIPMMVNCLNELKDNVSNVKH